MKSFINWVRRNAAILVATSALVGVAAPELSDIATAVTTVATSLGEPANPEPSGSKQP